MKAYQWFTLIAAIVITDFEALLFTSASAIFSPIENADDGRGTGADPPVCSRVNRWVANSPSKSGEAPKANYSRASGALATLAVVAVLGGPSTGAAEESVCDARLIVELSPSVPRASDDGFRSGVATGKRQSPASVGL